MKHHLFVLALATMTGAFAAPFDAPIGDSECLADYFELFKKTDIHVTLAFGYDDFEKITEDRKNSARFIQTLTAPCKLWSDRMCGFTLTTKPDVRPAILRKVSVGPDGKNRNLIFHIDNPSLSDNDPQNRANPLQKQRSKDVKEFFLNGLKTSEVTFYLGHSRDGGGPSFDPPVLAADGHVNYDYYHKHKKDKNDMNKALQETATRTRIVGLLSCSSVRWFATGIYNSSASSGFIGTNGDYYAGGFNHALVILDKIFSYECLKDLAIPDVRKHSTISTAKEWKVPARDKKRSKDDVKREAIENLSLKLTDPNPLTRREAYLELKEFDAKLFSPAVNKRLHDYEFGLSYMRWGR